MPYCRELSLRKHCPQAYAGAFDREFFYIQSPDGGDWSRTAPAGPTLREVPRVQALSEGLPESLLGGPGAGG